MQPIIDKAKRTINTPERIVQVLLLVIILVGLWMLFNQSAWVPKLVKTITANDPAPVQPTVLEPLVTPVDYKSLTHMVDGHIVTLEHGYYEAPAAPGSATKLVTQYFGNEALGDINGDGQADIVFLLTQETGGTGVFFYVVAALKTETGYVGTNAVFLGDRIAPQTTEIKEGNVIVNYAQRRSNEPMSAAPSVAVSKYITVKNSTLFEVPKGE